MRPRKFVIRPLESRDAESIQSVALESWRHTYRHIFPEQFISQFVQQNYDPEQIKQFVGRHELGTHFFVVAEAYEEIVGFCHLAKTENGIQLLRIYLRPSRMRQGIGQAFLEQAEQYVRESNYPYYFCYIHEKNKIGKAFYLKNGFQNRRKKDVRDELYMEKWVGGKRREKRGESSEP